MKRLFVDTNIVIDLLEKRAPFYHDAVILFTDAYNGKVELFISPITYATVSYVLEKKGAEYVKKKLGVLRSISQVTNTDSETIDKAISSGFNDVEDAIQYYGAIGSGCECIITRNGKDFILSEIPVMTAGEYINLLTD